MSGKRISQQHQATFDGIRHQDADGNEYWRARQLAKVLEYSEYRHFLPVIVRAKAACQNSGQTEANHFEDILEMVEIGSGAQRPVDDVRLSRHPTARICEKEADQEKRRRGMSANCKADTIDNATYRALNKVDALTASAALRRLRDAGLLNQQGSGSATWYQPTERMIGEQDGKSEALSGKSEPLSSMSEGLSSMPEPLSSNPKSVTRDALLDQLPGQLAARIGAIGLRHPPEQVRELVVELCSLRDWQAEELALLLNRRPETIRQDYLRPLLTQRRIAMTLPDKPKSPQQAYRSVEGGEE